MAKLGISLDLEELLQPSEQVLYDADPKLRSRLVTACVLLICAVAAGIATNWFLSPSIGALGGWAGAAVGLLGLVLGSLSVRRIGARTVLTNRRLLIRKNWRTKTKSWWLRDIDKVSILYKQGLTSTVLWKSDQSPTVLTSISKPDAFWDVLPDELKDANSDCLDEYLHRFTWGNVGIQIIGMGIFIGLASFLWPDLFSNSDPVVHFAVALPLLFGSLFLVGLAYYFFAFWKNLLVHRKELPLAAAIEILILYLRLQNRSYMGRLNHRLLPIYCRVLGRVYGTPVAAETVLHRS